MTGHSGQCIPIEAYPDLADRAQSDWRRAMLIKLSHIKIATALGAAALVFQIGSALSQAPRPQNDRTFEFGEGRGIPCSVSRRGASNDRYRYYRKGWWYDTPWWMGCVPYAGSTKAFRIHRGGSIADPYASGTKLLTAKHPEDFD
jgi:hypothetical protein